MSFIYDLARDDMSAAVADAFRYSKLVLATLTYNAGIYPFMQDFINRLTERSFQNRTIGLIENGSWAPTAAKVMKGMFEKSKNITWTENNVKVMSAVKEENVKEIEHWPKNSANKKLRREERIWEKCSAGLCERQRQRSLSFSSFGKKILWSSGGSRIALRWVKKSRGLNFAKACGRLFVSETASGF